MAIILRNNRPAIDIVQDSFTRPEEPWSHLGDAGPRAALQQVIPSVGKYAIVVGPNLLLSMFMAEQSDHGKIVLREESRFVDFRQEVVASEPLRVRIEEVLFHDELYHIQLLRAELPETLRPLRFSVKRPEDLVGRDVVIIGYPSRDERNDPKLSKKLFRGAYDVKRLLPGRTTGTAPYTSTPAWTALLHDCSTTGGCGGAPLVDIETGEIVGIHMAGKFLETNYAVPTAALAANSTYARLGVVFAGSLPAAARTHAPKRSVTTIDLGTLESQETKTVIDLGQLDDPDEMALAPAALERIVLPSMRPALPVVGGRFQLTGDSWEPVLSKNQLRIETGIRAVAQVSLQGQPGECLGSAFLVGGDIALTASFVVSGFSTGSADKVALKPGMQPILDFSQSLGMESGQATAKVTSVLFIHPFFQVALLRLDQTPAGVTFLEVASQLPQDLAGRSVALLSYFSPSSAGDQESHPEIFGYTPGTLFVQPGKSTQLGYIPGTDNVPALLHDCTSSTGAAGAPLIDLATGYALGVHIHGKYLEGGYAQPLCEVGRDPKVWDYSIRFRPDPKPAWLPKWGSPQEIIKPAPIVPARAQEGWTVNDPLDFSKPGLRQMEAYLIQNLSEGDARYHAENVGLSLSALKDDPNPRVRWRELLRAAFLAGRLRLFLEEIINSPNYAGLATHLRQWF